MTIWREGGREIGDCDKKWGEICSLIRTGKLRMNYRVRGRGGGRNRLIRKLEYECAHLSTFNHHTRSLEQYPTLLLTPYMSVSMNQSWWHENDK